GHLHRAQKLPGATQIHYCGSPLQLDFGEQAEPKQVNLVHLAAGKPAKVTPLPLAAGSPLHTVAGTVTEIIEVASGLPEDAWLRARVDEPRRAGLADELRAALGDRGERLVEVQVAAAPEERGTHRPVMEGRAPRELFADYLTERGIDDPRLPPLFDELHDAAVSPDGDASEGAT